MSQGRPSNPSKGTPRPGEPSRPEGSRAPEASQTPEPTTPTGAQGGAAPTGSQPSAAPGQPSTKPAAAPGQPPATKPALSTPPESKPAESKPGDGKPSAGTPPGGRPTTPGAGGGQGGGTGPSSTGPSSTGPGGTGSGGRTPPPAAAPPAKGGGGGWVAGIIGGVVGAVLAVFGAPFVQGPPPLAPEAESRLAAIESLSDNLEPTVRTAVEEAVAEVPSRDGAAIAALAEEVEALTSTTSALDARLTEVAGQVETLGSEIEQQLGEAGAEVDRMIEETRTAASEEVNAAQAALGGEVETLRGQLTAAEAEVASLQDEVAALNQARRRAAAAALLVRDIDRSIENGSSFAEPLDRLLPMAADDATLTSTLEELRGYAQSGVPTMQTLRDGLLALAETEAPPEVAGSEFLGRTVQNLYGLVQVRSKEDEGAIAMGLLADADAALRAGDLTTAIRRVEDAAAAPDGVDADLAADWLADARARLAAVEAQAQLDAHIRELLTATTD